MCASKIGRIVGVGEAVGEGDGVGLGVGDATASVAVALGDDKRTVGCPHAARKASATSNTRAIAL